MVYYGSFSETLVSKAKGMGRPQIRKGAYNEDHIGQNWVVELPKGVKHPTEWSNFVAMSPSAAAEAKKVGSSQRDSNFSIQNFNKMVYDEQKQKSLSSIRLNPDAKTFVGKSIDWSRVPLRTSESSVSLSPHSESYDPSIFSISDDVTTTFGSSDGMFTRQNWAAQRESFIPPELNPRYHYPPGLVSSWVLQNIDEYSQLRKKPESYIGKKCYHCGCVGHMAKDCPRRKQGLEAVCFECNVTGHKASDCPTKSKSDVNKPEKSGSPLRAQESNFSAYNKISSDSNFKPNEKSKRTKTSSVTKQNERKRQNTNKTPVASQIKSKRTKNHPRTCNVPDIKANNPKENHSNRSYGRVTENHYNKICYEVRALTKIYENENTNLSTVRYRLQKLEDREAQVEEQSQVCVNEGGTDIDQHSMEKRDTEAALIDVAAQGITSIQSRWKKVHQIRSFQEALIKVLSMTVQTESYRVPVELSFGYHLAEDVCVPVDFSEHCSTMRDEISKNDGEKLEFLDHNWKTGHDQTDHNEYQCSSSTKGAGYPLFRKGMLIKSLEVIQMLSQDVKEVEVRRKPRVVMLSDGNLFVSWDSKDKKPHSIIDSSGPLLEAMVRECGGEIVTKELSSDNYNIEEEILFQIENCDLLLWNGSVSRLIKENSGSMWNLILSSVQMRSGNRLFFAPVKDRKSGKEKIFFALPGNLYDAVVAFHMVVKPSLKRMMGSSAQLKTIKLNFGEDLNLDHSVEEYRTVYFQEDNNGIREAKSTTLYRDGQACSLIGAQGLAHFPKVDKRENLVEKGAIIEVIPFGPTNLTKYIPITESSNSESTRGNQAEGLISVGIITIGEMAVKIVGIIKPMIRELFASKVRSTIKNQSKLQLRETLSRWTNGSGAKQIIFTVGGVSQKDNTHVQKVTRDMVDGELREFVAMMTNGCSGKLVYRGTIGICQKSLIVNLPEEVDTAKHYLKKMEAFVKTMETIIYALEK